MNDVAWALQTARKVGPIPPPRAHAHPIHKAHLVHTGPLRSHVAGRTDHLPSQVPNGSFVLPADIVSGLGEGNTEAGFKIAKRMFGGAHREFGGLPYAGDNGPYGQGGGLPYAIVRRHAAGGPVGEPGNPEQLEGIMAYHGSPHQFDQFDASKIGTGEGAQAYGHGLYFAQNEGVAKQYREHLSSPNSVPYKEMSSRFVSLSAAPGIVGQIAHRLTQGREPSTIAEDISTEFPQWKVDKKTISDAARYMADQGRGHMYQVRINAHPDHFLDWDKPLSEQSEHVRNAAAQLGWTPDKYRGQGLNGQPFDRMGSAIAAHSRAPDVQRMQQVGIRGIRYLDEGSRPDPVHLAKKQRDVELAKQTLEKYKNQNKPILVNQSQWELDQYQKALEDELNKSKSPTHNYVVFDPKDIQIMRRYAQGGDVEADQQAVPVAVAGGEHVLAPHEVAFAGLGDTEAGHKALEAFVLRQRAKLIQTLKGLPGPSND